MEKVTYEQLEEENKNLNLHKIASQKAAMHTVREMALTLTHLIGINNLPVKIDLDFDYDRENFLDYIPKSMIIGSTPKES